MKAVTLFQPYATAVALDVKKIETRGFRTHHRGEIAIHAGKFTPVANAPILHNAPEAHRARFIAAGYETAGKANFIKLPNACIVAIAEIVAVEATEIIWATPEERHWGDYSAGRFGWILTNIRRLATPIPARGNQGLWDWTPPADLRFADSAPSSVLCPPSSSASRLPVLPAYRLPTAIKRPPFSVSPA